MCSEARLFLEVYNESTRRLCLGQPLGGERVDTWLPGGLVCRRQRCEVKDRGSACPG